MRLALVLFVVGCGGDQPQTVADGCYDWGTTLCQRGQDCGLLATTQANCRSAFVADCCTGNACAAAITHYDVFQNCNRALASESCGDLSANLLPRACLADGGT